MVKINNVFLTKDEIEEVLNALNLAISESQEIDEVVNLELQAKLSKLFEE